MASACGVKFRPPDKEWIDPAASAFDLACQAMVYLHAGLTSSAKLALELMVKAGSRTGDGEVYWPSGAGLCAPANWPSRFSMDEHCFDGHGIFTLATVARTLAMAQKCGALKDLQMDIAEPRSLQLRGLETVKAAAVSLNKQGPFPLCSTLSDGQLIEYSVRLGAPFDQGRYACEFIHPRVPAKVRYQLMRESLFTAQKMPKGYALLQENISEFLADLAPQVQRLADPRFLLWAGAQHGQSRDGDLFKLYINGGLLGDDSQQSRVDILAQKLLQAGVISASADPILYHYAKLFEGLGGKLQEFGFGFGQAGHAIKIYWEFPKWCPGAIEGCRRLFPPSDKIANPVFLDDSDWDLISPLSYRRRAPMGLALKLGADGSLKPDLTVAVPVPASAVKEDNFHSNFKAYCSAQGRSLQAISEYLETHKNGNYTPSLITRTLKKDGISDTVYVRASKAGRLNHKDFNQIVPFVKADGQLLSCG